MMTTLSLKLVASFLNLRVWTRTSLDCDWKKEKIWLWIVAHNSRKLDAIYKNNKSVSNLWLIFTTSGESSSRSVQHVCSQWWLCLAANQKSSPPSLPICCSDELCWRSDIQASCFAMSARLQQQLSSIDRVMQLHWMMMMTGTATADQIEYKWFLRRPSLNDDSLSK